MRWPQAGRSQRMSSIVNDKKTTAKKIAGPANANEMLSISHDERRRNGVATALPERVISGFLCLSFSGDCHSRNRSGIRPRRRRTSSNSARVRPICSMITPTNRGETSPLCLGTEVRSPSRWLRKTVWSPMSDSLKLSRRKIRTISRRLTPGMYGGTGYPASTRGCNSCGATSQT